MPMPMIPTSHEEKRRWSGYDEARDAYANDTHFKQVVDVLYALVDQLHMTPSEIRSAATYASILWEMRHPKPIFVDEATFGLVDRIKDSLG